MKSFRIIILTKILLLSVSVFAIAPCDVPTDQCKGTIEVVPNGKFNYYSTFNYSTPNPEVTTVVLVVHGLNRVVPDIFNQMIELVRKEALPANTLIIIPHFLARDDKPAAEMLFWEVGGWPIADNSLDLTKTSSFTALDQLIRQTLANKNFPNLKGILITGFSAGGQTVQRYAAGNQVENEFPNIRFRYLVAAPSSYMYLNEDRLVPGTEDRFEKPANPGCAYNTYRYGMEGLNSYMIRKTKAQMVNDYLVRDIVYTSGALDDATEKVTVSPVPYDWKDAMHLDVSCQARWQGNSRVHRSFIFHRYVLTEFPWTKHTWFSVPGVAHEYRVYTDPRAIQAMTDF